MLTTKKPIFLFPLLRTKENKNNQIFKIILFDNNRLAKVRLFSEPTKILDIFFFSLNPQRF